MRVLHTPYSILHHKYLSRMVLKRLFPKLNRSQLELFRFSFYLLTPIGVMYYVGIDADKKFNVPGFWPDPETTNKIPKEPHEIKAELARMKRESLEKRKKLEEKLINEYGLDLEEERAKLQAGK